MLGCLHQSGQQGILVAAVPAELQAGKYLRLLPVQLRNQRPGAILGTIIDKQHPAVGSNPALGRKLFQLFP